MRLRSNAAETCQISDPSPYNRLHVELLCVINTGKNPWLILEITKMHISSHARVGKKAVKLPVTIFVYPSLFFLTLTKLLLLPCYPMRNTFIAKHTRCNVLRSWHLARDRRSRVRFLLRKTLYRVLFRIKTTTTIYISLNHHVKLQFMVIWTT